VCAAVGLPLCFIPKTKKKREKSEKT